MKPSSIPRYGSAPSAPSAPRPKLGTHLTSPGSPPGPKSPTSPKVANGNVSHQSAELHITAHLETGPVLESPKGSRTPIGAKSPMGIKSPIGSPRNSLSDKGSLRSPSSAKSLPPKSPSHAQKTRVNGSESKLSDRAKSDKSERSEETEESRGTSDRGFDSFVMTGEMIIRTTPKKAGSLERGTSPQTMSEFASSPSSSSTPEKYDENSNQHCFTGPPPTEDTKHRSCMVTSKSAEKVQYASMNKNLMSCYTSKSHENYLENSQSYVVDIDIDDKIATSFDALMLEQSSTSIDRLIADNRRERSEFFRLEGTRVQEESSSDMCPNCRSEILDTVCACVDDSRPPPLPADRSSSKLDDFKQTNYPCDRPSPSHVYEHSPYARTGERLYPHERCETVEDDSSETGSIYHQPTKDIDRPSAMRLAKRLYNLEGFRKSDVSRHLSKKNDFSQLVGEEYLKYFDFKRETLDKALRKFLSRFSLTGETQERERILNHFSHRYIECNPNTYNSDDACHTLTCAIMLLNTDLHGQNIGRKMTSSEFVENLSDLNDGEDFPAEVLRQLYSAIKAEPLIWALDEEEGQNGHCPSSFMDNGMISAQNPFLMVPDPTKTTEYISGYVMRKCCIDQDGRRTPMGKRSWKMFYATLKDMILYLHKDQNSFHKTSVYHMNNAIRIHHALAVRANDYTKKHHVFRLKTADWAEYLFQTSDSKELQRWIDTINYVAASLSPPPLPGAVGSQRKFQRPLMPSSYTRLNLQQQLLQHESRLDELERDLKEHRTYPPEKGAKPRIIQDYLEKENYLEYELKRFNMYVYLLQARLQAFPPAPDLEPSLVETVIGEVDETNASPVASRTDTDQPPPDDVVRRPISDKHARHVQRSLSDRYSYRAAIFRPEDTSGELLADTLDGAASAGYEKERSIQSDPLETTEIIPTTDDLGHNESHTLSSSLVRGTSLWLNNEVPCEDETVKLMNVRPLEESPLLISEDGYSNRFEWSIDQSESVDLILESQTSPRKTKTKRGKLWFRRTVIEIPEAEVTNIESMDDNTDSSTLSKQVEKTELVSEADANEQRLLQAESGKKKSWLRKFASRTPEPKRAKLVDTDTEPDSPHLTRSLPDGTFFSDERQDSFSSGKMSANSASSANSALATSSSSSIKASKETAEVPDTGVEDSEPLVMRLTDTVGPLLLRFDANVPDVAGERTEETSSPEHVNRISNVDLPELEIDQANPPKSGSLKRWFKRKRRSPSFQSAIKTESKSEEREDKEAPTTPEPEADMRHFTREEKRSSATWYSRESAL